MVNISAFIAALKTIWLKKIITETQPMEYITTVYD